MKVLAVAALLFVATLGFGHASVIGTEIIPCDSSLIAYCATADVLGTGLAWLLWIAVGSVAIGWALVTLPKLTR